MGKRRGKRKKNKNISKDTAIQHNNAPSHNMSSNEPGSIGWFFNECYKLGFMPYDILYGLYRFTWEGQKITEIPAKDATREGWAYEGQDVEPDILTAIASEEERLSLNTVIMDALILERLYGGAAVLIGTKEKLSPGINNFRKQAALPLDIDNIEQGDLLFLRAIPRSVVTPMYLDTDRISPDYNRSLIYNIYGHQVHSSRLLIFDGGGDRTSGVGARFLDYTADGFGLSKLEPLIEDIIAARGGRAAAFHLLHQKSIPYFKQGSGGEAQNLTKTYDKKVEKLKEILNQASIYRGAFIDHPFELDSYQASFDGVPDFMMKQLQVLSAGSDIPAPRFMSEAPGGLNRTGAGELKNYYDGIKGDQTYRVLPRLNKLKPILIRSALGEYVDGVTIKFNPLYQLSAAEQADIRQKDWVNIKEAVEIGMGDMVWGRKEASERNIFLKNSDDPEGGNAPDDPEED